MKYLLSLVFILMTGVALANGGAIPSKTVEKPAKENPLDKIPYGYNGIGACSLTGNHNRNFGTIFFLVNDVKSVTDVKFKVINTTSTRLNHLIDTVYKYKLDGFTTLFNLGAPVYVGDKGNTKIIRAPFEFKFKLIVSKNNYVQHFKVNNCKIVYK